MATKPNTGNTPDAGNAIYVEAMNTLLAAKEAENKALLERVKFLEKALEEAAEDCWLTEDGLVAQEETGYSEVNKPTFAAWLREREKEETNG